jgi:hypothetical protein
MRCRISFDGGPPHNDALDVDSKRIARAAAPDRAEIAQRRAIPEDGTLVVVGPQRPARHPAAAVDGGGARLGLAGSRLKARRWSVLLSFCPEGQLISELRDVSDLVAAN